MGGSQAGGLKGGGGSSLAQAAAAAKGPDVATYTALLRAWARDHRAREKHRRLRRPTAQKSLKGRKGQNSHRSRGGASQDGAPVRQVEKATDRDGVAAAALEFGRGMSAGDGDGEEEEEEEDMVVSILRTVTERGIRPDRRCGRPQLDR